MAAFAVNTQDVFIGTDTGASKGTVYAADRRTGKLHWNAPIDGSVDRPALVGDLVYVAVGPGGLHAFDTHTGHEAWKAPVDGYSEDVVVTGGIAVVSTHDASDTPGSVTAFVAKSDPRAPSP